MCYIWLRCLRFLGRDAAGAFASRRPPNETGGWHGSGLCKRDHDPHALPPERDHHFHIQTGTLHLLRLLPNASSWKWLPEVLFWLGKSEFLMHLIICWNSKTNHCVWKQRLLTHSFIIHNRCATWWWCLCVCICEETSVARFVWREGQMYTGAVLR